ncbi:MAG: PQ-loop domain-containing transporter [Candidatus Thermoplasmatota archaeon]
MDSWDLLIWAGSAGFILCLVPQLWRTVHRRRADDISLGFLILVLLSSSLTLPYMLHEREFVFGAAQAVNVAVWGTVLYFKLFPAPVTHAAQP